MNEDTINIKKDNLVRHLKKLGSLLVAFSGGVDSTFLLAVAHQTLGEKMMAATAKSAIHPTRETGNACDFTREKEIHHIVFPSDEMSLPVFVSNSVDRCYHCKRHLFDRILGIAKENGITHVAHGENLDDLNDYRPGFRAAKETGVIAPLIEAGLNKEEIRFLSKEMGLSTWDKPAVPCLATRIPYGSAITEDKLKMIEQAEVFLSEQGFTQVRVRHHGSVARIEVASKELKDLLNETPKKAIVKKFHTIGFEHVAVDLEGYVSGKMNRSLKVKLNN
ncbi:MAG: ATP-dependent sacrificial sulfur transferase LarE [Deltaproteobacteria bacterium]|nr:ATP-dependent sacrificial sulfur transferase LarE [Deltaproteobacteria bacterium]MBW1735957.1 ATP-dependent sacrificial sulfur transferase LarE [Deltaproteobacteria bacterium]MBW1908266.1 ATP-dependent sacrificial sulfur transferase LarE [Deltaproteobacteria bacterium]MBW2032248.1 ATP-dependent sacrificial sulfur transferase LarE [Deltaproteobacteria bacterium]MBW2113261.1 ATP-dependent sacrificial sulfur transferase LarE [Deltaproteobacteria bacterium]